MPFLARLTTAVSPFYHGVNQWGSSTTDEKMLREADSFRKSRCLIPDRRMCGWGNTLEKRQNYEGRSIL